MRTIEEIINMKKEIIPPDGNSYIHLFMNIKNALVNDDNRAFFILKEYDADAKIYIFYQFVKVYPTLKDKLVSALKVDPEGTSLESKYTNELIEDF